MDAVQMPPQPINNRYNPRKRKPLWGISITILSVIFLISFGLFAWIFLVPNNDQLQTFSMDNTTIILDNEIIDQTEFQELPVIIKDGKPLLSYDMVQRFFDPYLHWDNQNQLLIMTTETAVIEMRTDQLSAFFNDESVRLEMPVTVIEDIPYIPIDFFAEYYRIIPTYYQATNTLIIDSIGLPIQKGIIQKDTSMLRLDTHIKEPIVANLSMDNEVNILGEKGNWYKVRTIDGIFGYAVKSDIRLAGIQLHAAESKERNIAWKPLGGKINLTWEQVHNKTPNPADIPELSGVNVVSPTWFSLKDVEGNVSGDKATNEYVDWAHTKGMHVWALYSNQFDPDLTRQFLKDPEARKRSIRQILGYVEVFNLDGINIDFENVYFEDKALLTQYVRELSPYLREQGVVVSIDVTILSQSPNWSMVYDRIAFADTVDYVMVMTYDEHWGASPVAGSVASLPWVERGLQGVLEQVPKDKLILGVPFYTRVWKEQLQSDGSVKVSSRAVSMKLANEIIDENNATVIYDDKAKQYYAEYQEGNNKHKIWLETTESMQERIKLVRKYDLAGVASWSRGFEQPEIWETIETVLAKQPLKLVIQE